MAPKFLDVLSDSNRIINAQPRHYLTLSLVFLLPISFLSLLSQLYFLHLQQQQPPTNFTTIISLSLFFTFISSIISIGAIITITYSVFHAFFNRPIKLKEAIKSIYTSFFPLLATNIVIYTIIFFVFFLLLLLFGLVFFLIIYLGHVDVTTNPNFVAIYYMVMMLVLLPILIYLMINLTFAKIIVVVESRWGFEPLKRSWKLMKGMKRLVLSIILLFGFMEGILLWICNYTWILIFVISPIIAILSLYNIAVYTVLYIYCKEEHGEELPEVEFGDKTKDEANLSLIPL